MSPTVLANMWKEEEARTKVLEEKLTALLKEKKVRFLIVFLCNLARSCFCFFEYINS